MRKCPTVLELLETGALTVTAVGLLSAHLTSENHQEVLAAARHKSKREVEHLVAEARRASVGAEVADRRGHDSATSCREVCRGQPATGSGSNGATDPRTARTRAPPRAVHGVAANPYKLRRAQGSRHIPARVKREVWKRDDGRCTFVGPQGRCAETGFLQFHHVEPYATGGPATVGNIELRCAAHNRYEADLFFHPSEPSVVRENRAAYMCH